MAYRKLSILEKIKNPLILLLVAILFNLSGCDYGYGEQEKSWKEEVELSTGGRIWVKRTANYTKEVPAFIIGGEGGNLSKMMLSITIPSNSVAPPPPVWRFDAVPLLLDYDVEKKTWFIVAENFYCREWESAGRPSTTPWQYEVHDNQWVIVPLNARLIGHRANLFVGFSDKEFKSKDMTVEDVKKTQDRSVAEGYKKIIVEKSNCH